MIAINIGDRHIFGNEAGEDEKLEILNSYYINNDDFDRFFEEDMPLSVVSARKGMGKSAVISRLEYKLNNDVVYGEPIVIRVKGNDLLGLGDFKGKDHIYLENYWKQIICKKIIIDIGAQIGIALSSNSMSMVEIAEIDGLKNKNFVSALFSRVKAKIAGSSIELGSDVPQNSQSILQNYIDSNKNKKVWVLIDDIDAKYQDTTECQDRIGSFFSAIRGLAFDFKSINIRATVRSDVWSNLRHLEDLDKWDQYLIKVFWSKRQLRDMLANRILSYVQRNFPDSLESKYVFDRDFTKIFNLIFETPIKWDGKKDASIFEAIASFSNNRPRWMGQLCRMSGEKAKGNAFAKKIKLEHIQFALSDFGKNRVDDLVKEHGHQFDDLVVLVDSIRATNKEFNYNEINIILSERYLRGREGKDIPNIDGKKYSNLDDLGNFMYRLGLISRIHPDGKKFTHYTDDPDLYNSIENKNKNSNLYWSIHPSYRTFLNIR